MTEAEIYNEITTSKEGLDELGNFYSDDKLDPQKLSAFLARHLPLENKV